MSWYKASEPKLSFDKPIVAYNTINRKEYMLVPQINKEEYTIVGYNWLCMDSGKYGSAACFSTPEKAIQAWSEYDMYNVKLVKA